MKTPREGQEWKVGTYERLIYQGVARDFAARKYMVFVLPNPKGEAPFFVVSKEDWYSPETQAVVQELE